jgi:hypothetical protein
MPTTSSTRPTRTRTEKGVSLARGPALILGTILEVAGLYFLYKQHGFPKLSNFPNGDAPVQGKVFFGIFGVNGWTGLFTAAAGGLLLFGAAQHLLAKTMSLIVGLALGAAAVIAVISGNVLGLAAANGWTRLGWGVCALILLFNTLVPRRTRTIEEPIVAERPVARERTMQPTRTQPAEAEPLTRARQADAGPVAPKRQAGTEPVTRIRQTEAEPVTQTQQTEAEPVTRTDAAGTEPIATREPGTADVERAGPMDDRHHEPAGETARRDLPPD